MNVGKKLQYDFLKMMGGGSKAVWNFSENSSVLELLGIPNSLCTILTLIAVLPLDNFPSPQSSQHWRGCSHCPLRRLSWVHGNRGNLQNNPFLFDMFTVHHPSDCFTFFPPRCQPESLRTLQILGFTLMPRLVDGEILRQLSFCF